MEKVYSVYVIIRILRLHLSYKRAFEFIIESSDDNNVSGVVRIGDADQPLCEGCSCDDCPKAALDREAFDLVLLCLTVNDTETMDGKTSFDECNQNS